MNSLCVILIEADPGNSLGNSCIRDCYNTANHISTLNYDISGIHVFTTQEISKFQNKFLSTKCKFYKINNIISQLHPILDSLPKNSKILCLITGHGYQTRDTTGDEMDGMDEYVSLGSERLIDDTIRSDIVNYIDDSIWFVGIADTCHSGTMFDLDYSWNGSKWILDTKRKCHNKKAISIGACRDSQLEHCDVGEVGFGGALVVHLLDNNCIQKLLSNKQEQCIEVLNTIKNILKVFKQQPVLQTAVLDWTDF